MSEVPPVPSTVRSARTVHVTRTAEGIELYFPPGRMPEVALPLAVFGIVAAAIPALAIAAFVPGPQDASSVLSAVLLSAFVLPFVAFGAIFVLLAVYMVANTLRVRVDDAGIETTRSVFGIVTRRRRVAHADIGSLEAQIASRFQSLFSAEPVYLLLARDMSRRRRLVVAETLVGEALMKDVKALIRPPFDEEHRTHG